MARKLKIFLSDESGAVTVDWVVLTAAIVGLSLGVVMTIRTAATDPAEGIASYMATINPGE